jgi:hypothetical protein
LLFLVGYTCWWYVWYRLPGQPDKVTDLRSYPAQGAYYVTFCAGLADNPIGFPGHAYVVWSEKPHTDPLKADSVGYITQSYNDQFVSPILPVPGRLHRNAALYNQRNIENLTAVVDQKTYRKTLDARENWNTSNFKALQHDCLSFTTYIAQSAGLNIPKQRCLYPQDQIRQLKALNQSKSPEPVAASILNSNSTNKPAATSILEANHASR